MMGPQINEPLSAANYPPGPPGGYGPPPGGGGYGPPPGAPGGYGPPPAPPGGSGPPPAPPGGYGPPPGAPGGPVQAQPPGGPPGAPPPAKKGGAGLIIGLVVGLLVLGGGAAAAWWFWLRSTGPELAVYMPKDTQLYIEVPSVTKALVSFVGIDAIDDKELDPDKTKGEAVEAFASSFDVSKDEAEAFLKGVGAVAVGVRDMNKDDQGGVLFSFGSKGDVEPLLASKRFDKDGDLAGGTKYKVYRREVDDEDKREKMSNYEKAFNDIGGRKKDKDEKDDKSENACVWWEDKKVLGCGDSDFIEDVGKVMSGDKESLAKGNETFAKAKWPAGSSLLVYLDPEAIDDKDAKKDYLDGVGPMLGSARFTDAGLVMNLRAELKGKKLPDDKVYGSPADLTLYERLPTDTVAYIGFSTKTDASYKDFEKDLLKSLEEADEDAGKKFEKGMEEMDKLLGFTLEDVYKAVGDEGILAVTASEKVDLEKVVAKDKEALDWFGVVLALHVKDKDAADKVIKGLKEAAEEKGKGMVEVDKKDGGFSVKAAEGDFPEGQLRLIDDKYLVLAVGNKKRIESINAAFAKEGDTLKGDKAHAKALGALKGKNAVFMWVDTGRIAKLGLKMDDEIKKKLKKDGVPIDALVLEGDDRLTGAFALRVEVKEGLWMLEAEDLNGMLASIGGAAVFGRMAGGFPKKVDDDDDGGGSKGGGNGGSGGSGLPSDIAVVGVAACDDYIKNTWKCAEKLGGQTGTSLKDSLKQSAEAWKKAAAHPSARSALEEGCKKASEGMKALCP